MFFGFGRINITVKVGSLEETLQGMQFIVFTKVIQIHPTSKNSFSSGVLGIPSEMVCIGNNYI